MRYRNRFETGISEFWEHFLLRKRSWLAKLLIQTAIAVSAFGIEELLHSEGHFYFGSLSLLAVVIMALFGNMLPTLILTMALALSVDYFFLPPFGSVLDNRSSIEHFLILTFSGFVLSLLVFSLRFSYHAAFLAMEREERARREEEKAKLQAEQGSAAMERILALVSHDIRNPLTATRSMAELLLRLDNEAEQRRLVARMIGSLDRADSMIQTLLDATRIRAGKTLPLEFTYCDLRPIVSATVEELRISYGDRFQLSFTEAVFGNWSAAGIRRMLENLATNALKYGSPDTQVRITALREGRSVLITVHNEGDPIPPGQQDKLFDTFHRAPSTQGKEGWGLGLTLVKGVVDAHRGAIEVESRPGAGTTFSVRFPL